MVAVGCAVLNVSEIVDVQPFALAIVSVGENKLFVRYVNCGACRSDVSPGFDEKFQCHETAPALVSVKLTVIGDEQLAPLFMIKGLMTGDDKTVTFFVTVSGQVPKFSYTVTGYTPGAAKL